MTREEVKKLLPIIKAFSEGETIQHLDIINNKWEDVDEFVYHGSVKSYRIKPEPKYRPFKNAEECWQELLKHEPFGWVKDTEANEYLNVYCISNSDSSLDLFGRMFKRCIFIDGSPYGIKVEK